MKNVIILPALVLVSLLFSCSTDDTIYGSGQLASEFRDVNLFTKVNSEGVFEVNITQGSSQSVEIIADDNVIHKVRTKVINNELRLYLDSDIHSYSNISLKANISAIALSGIRNSGVGDMFVANVDRNGVFSIDNLGTGNIAIDGTASNLNIRNEGSGKIFGFDLLVNDCSVHIEGSGDVEVSCTDHLEVDINGSGSVFYKGNPVINTSVSGSGEVVNAN